MIRVLHVLAALSDGGGVQVLLRNYYKEMDTENYKFDFAVYSKRDGEVKRYFEQQGSRIYQVTPRGRNAIKNLWQMRNIIKNGNYDIVHTHQTYLGLSTLAIAKLYGVKGRIIHTHSRVEVTSFFAKQVKKVLVLLSKKIATDFFSCSNWAQEYFWGEGKAYEHKLMHNAIDLEKYKFSYDVREKVRKHLGLTDSFVVGHVGRFTPIKNHKFILKIFKLLKDDFEDVKLLLVGEGKLLPETKSMAAEMGLTEDIIFAGERNDVHELLQAMDVMVFPSTSEGLGIVAIEAQAAGLSVVCSEAVPREVNVTGMVKYVSLDDESGWCDAIKETKNDQRVSHLDTLKNAGYDINHEAKQLEKLYNEISGDGNS